MKSLFLFGRMLIGYLRLGLIGVRCLCMRSMLSVLSPLLFRFALHLDHKLYILLKSKFQKIEEKPYIDNTLPDFIFDGVRLPVSRSSISCVSKKDRNRALNVLMFLPLV